MRLAQISHAAIAASLLATPVYAQDAGSDEGEIIVTARKREERLIEVPVVVTAVSGEQLDNRGITNLDGIARLVPQLMIGPQGGSVQGGNVSIRGVAGPDSNPFGDQAVSFNVDGMQIAKATVRRMADVDIAQVEVLKGPQALFFGKNSPAGIVSIRTADPGAFFEAGIKAGYEFEAKEKRVEGFISTPLTDSLGFRFAGLFSDMSGYVKDVTPETAPFNYQPRHGHNPNKTDFAVRGTMLFDPGPFSARLKVNYGETKTNGPASLSAFTSCPTGVRQTGSGIDQCKASDGASSNAGYGPVVATIPGPLNFFREDGENFQKQKQFLASLELNYDLSDTVSLTSVTGYYDVKLDQCQNYENDPSFILPSCNPYEGNEFSQELRIATDFDEILNFIGGVYYAKTNYKTGSITYLFGGNFDLLGPGFGGPTSPALVNNYYLQQKGTAWSAYGQISLKPVEQFELTVGGRYSHEKKRLPLVQSGGGLTENYPVPFPGSPLLTDVEGLAKYKDSWKDFSPEITASFRPSQNLTIFGSYKQGFLSGGFNSSSISFNQASPTVIEAGIERPRRPDERLDISFDPQTVEGYEAGVKAALLDNRLLLNLAAYTYKIDDLQVSNFTNATSTIRNAGKVKVKGIEADFSYRTPLEGLTVRGAAAYNKGRYTEYPNAPCYNGQTQEMGCFIVDGNPSQDLKGEELIRAPKWNLTGGFDYETPLGTGLELGLSAGATYSSSYLTDATADPLGRQGSYTLLDGSIRVGAEDDLWEVALIGKNLTNKWIYYASANVPFTGGAAGLPASAEGAGILGDRFASLGRGREIMLRVGFKFDGGAAPAPDYAPPPPPPAAAPPPPPPPPPVVECNTGPYIVFFDWDKSDITPEAAGVLDNAVTSYANCGSAQVMLAGHADRSGSASYNVGLSQRRNDSTRGYMTSRGVPDGVISSQAFGETQNRVPTADGVRELQNRRVEITYGPGSGN